MRKSIISISFLIYIFSILPYSTSMAYEESQYDVVYKSEIYEVRHYKDRLVVEVVSRNDDNSFRKLFKYISGQNNKSQEIKMTVPVTQGERDNGYYMQFYLPSKFRKETIPMPSNQEIKIAKIEEGFFAVINYSGRASEDNFIKHSAILESKLLEDKILIKGTPIKATYNGPFTLPFLRRNEAMFSVEWKN